MPNKTINQSTIFPTEKNTQNFLKDNTTFDTDFDHSHFKIFRIISPCNKSTKKISLVEIGPKILTDGQIEN